MIRRGLLDMSISYRGTVTNFRRAAATLTGCQNPAVSEKMAQLMSHSRKAHDKHYRMQSGQYGLLCAYKVLENMQKNPSLEGPNPKLH